MLKLLVKLIIVVSFIAPGYCFAITADGSRKAPGMGKLCTDLENELVALQKKEQELTSSGENGAKLIELKQDYDNAVARYTIYKGIQELRNNYLNFKTDVEDLDLGDKPKSETVSALKGFFNDLFGKDKNPKLKDIQEFRERIRDGMVATAGILKMEEMLDNLMDKNEKGSLQKYIDRHTFNIDADTFISNLGNDCSVAEEEKMVFDSSQLCQGLYRKNKKGILVEKQGYNPTRKMVLGFFEAYSALRKNPDDKDAVAKSLSKYKNVLMKNMPKSEYIKEQLALVKKADKNIGLKFDRYSKDLTSTPNLKISDADKKSVNGDIKNFFTNIDQLSKGQTNTLGVKEREAMRKDSNAAALNTQFGNISELVQEMGSDVDKKHNEIVTKMLIYQDLSKKRHALAKKSGLTQSFFPLSAKKMYHKLFDELGNHSPSCKGVSYTQNINKDKKQKDILYQCLSNLGEISGEDPINKITSDAKNESRRLLSKIKKIENSRPYKNLDFFKNIIADNYKNTCKAKIEKSCVPDNYRGGLYAKDDQISFLASQSGEILADLNKGVNRLNASKEQAKLANLCKDKEYEVLAKSTCKRALHFNTTVQLEKNYRWEEGSGKREGHRTNPTPTPSNTSIVMSAGKAPLNLFANFAASNMWFDANLGAMQEKAEAQKTYNTYMDEMFTNNYSLFSSTSFNFGSTGSYYGVSGYSFTNT